MLVKRCLPTLLLVLVGFAAAAPARTANPRYDVYTVSPVPVDATAASAAAARDQAIVEGEQHALQLLLGRLTLAGDRGKLPRVSTARLNDLVQGFEVANEHHSGVRYLADLTIHFRPEAVRQMLRQSGVGFAETVSRPLLILPVFHAGDQLVLWDDPNPWRDAWASAKLMPGLVPLVRPLGELEDVQAIDGPAAASGDPAKIQAISARYDNDDVLVTQAALKSGGVQGVDVTSTRYSPGSPGAEQTWVTSTVANPGEDQADMLTRAAAEAMAQVEDAWKAANILDFRQSGTITARVPVTELQDWIAVRDRLAAIPSVRSSRLVSLDRESARVEIRYVGGPTQLRVALAQRDLELAGNDPDWVLQRRATMAPH